MGKIDKFQVWQDTFDQIYKINSFLNKIDSSSASDIKKAESILKKVSSVAQKDKK